LVPYPPPFTGGAEPSYSVWDFSSGPDGPDGVADPSRTASPKATVTPSSMPTVLTPETGAPIETGEPTAGISAAPVVDDSSTAPVDSSGHCTDDEISVIPVPSQTSMQRGVTIELRLRIKNISTRTCDRDVGPGPQEMYLKRGAETVWSSDICNQNRDSNVRTFPSNLEHEYRITWNGRDASRCDGEAANGKVLEAGEYELFGRLGTKISEPVKLTIVA
jgi:hypothetical protein